MKILYVEDDRASALFVQKGLGRRGYEVDVAYDGRSGFESARNGNYDLLILDVMVPGASGFEVLRELRRSGIETPALFLSARGETRDRVEGLNLGADDYLTKPFAIEELEARVRSITRRSTRPSGPPEAELADLVIDPQRHSAARAGRHISLTPTEYRILEHMMRHRGEVRSRRQLLDAVWGGSTEASSNLVDVHVGNLRRKIDGDHERKLFHTVSGVGYVLEEREPEPS